ncbi:hypothetical protein J4211_05665 [Candidatus Woesearchaeota archaeon]|nr:hypothetical protein [Candidatus Woesearchaeota archaeon]
MDKETSTRKLIFTTTHPSRQSQHHARPGRNGSDFHLLVSRGGAEKRGKEVGLAMDQNIFGE